MGTTTYVTLSDLDGENPYYEDFFLNLYGTNGAVNDTGSTQLLNDIYRASDIINEKLRATGRFSYLPLQKDRYGNYPESVKSWCAYLVVYNKLLARFQGEYDEIPDSISVYGSFAKEYEQVVLKGGAIFEEEIDVGELGIGRPIVIGALGEDTRGTFYNNWQGYPFPDSIVDLTYSGPTAFRTTAQLIRAAELGFTGSDYPRTWIVEIDKSGGIGTATFKWSKNAGKDWEETGVATDEDWNELEDNVWVRFSPDDAGSHYFTDGDKWRFFTIPKHMRRVYGEDEMKIHHGGRRF